MTSKNPPLDPTATGDIREAIEKKVRYVAYHGTTLTTEGMIKKATDDLEQLFHSSKQQVLDELLAKLPLATSTPEELAKANKHLDSRGQAYWDAYNRGYCSLSDQVHHLIAEMKEDTTHA